MAIAEQGKLNPFYVFRHDDRCHARLGPGDLSGDLGGQRPAGQRGQRLSVGLYGMFLAVIIPPLGRAR